MAFDPYDIRVLGGRMDKTDEWDARNAKTREIVQVRPGVFVARDKQPVKDIDGLPMIPADAPEIGTTWQHYKDKHVYKVLGFILDSETLVWKVSYQRVEGGIVWGRPISMWNNLITTEQGREPRFKQLPWSE